MRQYPYNIYFPHSNVVVDIQFFILVLFYHPDSLDIKFCSLDVLAKDAKVHSCIDGRDKYTFFQRGVKENVSYTNGGDKLLVCTPPPTIWYNPNLCGQVLQTWLQGFAHAHVI